jgi:3-hydroxybutyryl-CoA dehydrogenase
MHLTVWANDEQKAILLSKYKKRNVFFEFVNEQHETSSYKHTNAIFILQNNINLNLNQPLTKQPVFIHSVISTLSDLNLPGNISRINAWPTFLENDLWEISTKEEYVVKNIFEKIGWKYIIIPDEPGLIAARVIAMIINEAYFTYGDGVSTKDEIDTAIKLGTNYPYGPFEWAQKIGLQNIYELLKALNKNSKRYSVAPAMENELVNSIDS